MDAYGGEMKPKSLGKNAVLNALRSIIAVIFPIITYPYAARVMGVDNMGRIGYVASYIEYFTLLAVFGVSDYAVRECAAVRDDGDESTKRARLFWSFNICTTLISLFLLCILVLSYYKLRDYSDIFLVQSLSIIFTTVGAEWLCVVYEDYGYITIRGIAINIINMVLLFTLVKSPDDYLLYAFLNVSTVVFSGFLNCFYIRRYVKLKPVFSKDMIGLIKPLLPFFINALSIAVYVGADTVILGIMKGDHYVGIYTVAVKIYTIVKSVFIAIFSVTVSRLSIHAAKKEMKEYKDILSGVISVFIILGFPAMTGMILYAEPIVKLVGGPGYEDSRYSLGLLAVALLFAIFGGIVTNCINVPLGYEKVNSKATLIAAFENTVLNIPVIYLWSERGAAFTTILAEFTVLAICVFNLSKKNRELFGALNLRDLRDSLAGLMAMAVLYIVLSRVTDNYIILLAGGVTGSVVVYFGILLCLKNHMVQEGIGVLKNKLGKN